MSANGGTGLLAGSVDLRVDVSALMRRADFRKRDPLGYDRGYWRNTPPGFNRRETTMPISQDLLEILCCPRTRVPVEMLSEELLAQLNEKIGQGAVKYYDDKDVDKPLQEGLVTEDGAVIYRIDDSIPVMLVEQGIPAEQLSE